MTRARSRRPGVAAAAVALVTALLLSACTGGDDGSPRTAPSSSSTPTPSAAPPPPPRPAVDACYRISHDEALAPTSSDPPVACRKNHTSQTFAVGRLDLLVNGHLLAVDSQTARRQVARRCPGRLASYVGATDDQLRLSLLRPVWFTPTLEESDAGADWYRCDVIAVTGDSRLAKLTGSLAGAFGAPGTREEYAMCGTAQPGADAFAHVLCREEHTWRAISVVELTERSERGRYPGAAVVRAAGEDVCVDAAREVASDPLDFEWGYEWPTKDQWQAGQTYGRCWSPDPA